MGIFDEAIKKEQNQSDAKEMDRIRKLEAKEAEQRAFTEAAEKLVPYVRTALKEFPDACKELGCEYITIIVRRKPTFFNHKEYEKWNGIPVAGITLTTYAEGLDHTDRFYEEYLVFIRDNKYYVAEDLKARWQYGSGIPFHLNTHDSKSLSIYTDKLVEAEEITIDEAAEQIADRLVRTYRMYEKADAASKKGTGGFIDSAMRFSFSKETAGIFRDSFTEYSRGNYEKAVSLFFMFSFKMMQEKKDGWMDKLIQEY